jgi:hypothetical protein
MMRAAHGNTGNVDVRRCTQPSHTQDDVEVTAAWWNARRMRADGSTPQARDKLEFLFTQLEASRPTVLFILEVSGSMTQFRVLRRRLKRYGYTAYFLPGDHEEDGEQPVNENDNEQALRCGGIVAAVDRAQARLQGCTALEQRTLGVRLSVKGEQAMRRFSAVHGIMGDEGAFIRQLDAAEAYVREEGGGLVLGDLNHVPCTKWRLGGTPLKRGDRRLRRRGGWTCKCCYRASETIAEDAYVVGGAGGTGGGEGTVEWTRFETIDEDTWGEGTSRIDLALAMGGGVWSAMEPTEPSIERRTVKLVSDHLWCSASTPKRSARQVRKTRPTAPAFRGNDEAANRDAMLRDELQDEGEGDWMMHEALDDAALHGTSAADAAVATVMEVTALTDWRLAQEAARRRKEARGRRNGLASPRRRYFLWRGRLREVAAQRKAGITAASSSSFILHPATGLQKLVGCHGDGWDAITRRCRRELEAASIAKDKATRRELVHLAELGRKALALEAGSNAQLRVVQMMLRDAKESAAIPEVRGVGLRWRSVGAQRPEGARLLEHPSLASALQGLTDKRFSQAEWRALGAPCVRPNSCVRANDLYYVPAKEDLDTPEGLPIHTARPEAAETMAAIGEKCVAQVDDGAVPAAYQAFSDRYIGQLPPLTAMDGSEFCLSKALAFTDFKKVVLGLPDKAVGESGLSTAHLKRAGDAVLKSVYRALVRDVADERLSDRWHRVLYVLIAKKPPNRRWLIGENREIALTEHDTKILLHMVRRATYRRLVGRTVHHNLGWLPGYGCHNTGTASNWIVQQARRLGHPLYLLFLDLSQFFPRVHRQCMRIGEVAHGLPKEVIRLAALIYGADGEDENVARCCYDSAGGLSQDFTNGLGLLMGCPLSTDRARIFMNAVLVAIHVHAKGVVLWGTQADDGWRRVAQLASADDWLGLHTDEHELRKAWEVWKVWEPMSGAKVGIKTKPTQADKSILTGVWYDAAGKSQAIADPLLLTADGRRIPVHPPSYFYLHLGFPRRADMSSASALTALTKKVSRIAHRLRRLRGGSARRCKPRRDHVLLVSEAMLGGTAGYYLQDLYLTWKEAEDLEARWRAAYNFVMRRDPSTPAAELYERELRKKSIRTHIYAHGLTAMRQTVCEAMADVADTEHRACVRSGIALTLYLWGCRSDPAKWDASHLIEELQRALQKEGSRFSGDAWLLATTLLQQDEWTREGDEANAEAARAERWRFTQPAAAGEPLSPRARHWARPGGRLVFEGSGAAKPTLELLHEGYVATAHFSTKDDRGGWRWASYNEAAGANPALRRRGKAARAAWETTITHMTSQGWAPARPEAPTPASGFWKKDKTEPFQIAASVQRCRTANALANELHEARQGLTEEQDSAYWTTRLREWHAEEVTRPGEWRHGIVTGDTHANGAMVGYDLRGNGQIEWDGGQRTWGKREDTDESNYLRGWQERAAHLHRTFDLDEQGFLTHFDGERISRAEVGGLPVMLQFYARARWSLHHSHPTAPIVSQPTTAAFKEKHVHINLTAARASFEAACDLQAKFDPTHAVACDASKVEKEGTNGPYTVVARAAKTHDGQTLGGRLVEEDALLSEWCTTYFGEKAGTDDGLEHTPDGSRVILWVDSIAPVQGLCKYRRLPARRRAALHGAGRHGATCEQLARHELVIYHWQRSHVGCPLSEWADVAAAAEAEAEIPAECIAPRHEAASMLFARLEGGSRLWAQQRAHRLVQARLRARSEHTIYLGEDDVRPWDDHEEDAQLLASLRADRCFPSDAGIHVSQAAWRRRRTMTCPFGCGEPCTWIHFACECQDKEIRDMQRAWEEALHHVRGQLEPDNLPHVAVRTLTGWIKERTVDGWVAWPGGAQPDGRACEWDRGLLRVARAPAGGSFDGSGLEPGRRHCEDTRRAVSASIRAGTRLFRHALTATMHRWGEEMQRTERADSVMVKYMRRLRTQVYEGGPIRAAALRDNEQLRREADRGSARMRALFRQDLPRRARQARDGAEDEDVRPRWVLLRGLLRWRIRRWRLLGWHRVSLDIQDAHYLRAHDVTSRAATTVMLTAEMLRNRMLSVSAKLRERRSTARRPSERKVIDIRLARWATHGTLSGKQTQAATRRKVDLTLGEGKIPAWVARCAGQAARRRIESGEAEDGRGQWAFEKVLDVRRPEGARGTQLEALLEWKQKGSEPWWTPVNAKWIPDPSIRCAARELWRTQRLQIAPTNTKASQCPHCHAPVAEPDNDGQCSSCGRPTRKSLPERKKRPQPAEESPSPEESDVDDEDYVAEDPTAERAARLANRHLAKRRARLHETRTQWANIFHDEDSRHRASDGDASVRRGRGTAGAQQDHRGQARPSREGEALAAAQAAGSSLDTTANHDPLQQLLDETRRRRQRDEETRARVEREMAARMDTGVRVNEDLARAFGVRSSAPAEAATTGDPQPMATTTEDKLCKGCDAEVDDAATSANEPRPGAPAASVREAASSARASAAADAMAAADALKQARSKEGRTRMRVRELTEKVRAGRDSTAQIQTSLRTAAENASTAKRARQAAQEDDFRARAKLRRLWATTSDITRRKATQQEATAWFGQRFLDSSPLDVRVIMVRGVIKFVTAESLLLREVGVYGELGIYTADGVLRGDVGTALGRYGGEELARGEHQHADSIVRAAEDRPDATMLLTIWNEAERVYTLLDGAGAGPPSHVPWQLANDAIGTGRANTMQITHNGDFYARKPLPALAAAGAIESELCWGYDRNLARGEKGYWAHMEDRWWEALGSPCCPRGHRLRRRWEARAAIVCDSCEVRWVRAGTNFWGCASCDHDSCERCLRLRTAQTTCGWCNERIDVSCLEQHATCACKTLGIDTRDAQRDETLRCLRTPTTATVKKMLQEVDVTGDGSCWVYVLLLHARRLQHAARGQVPGAPTTRDRVYDKIVRGLICDQLAASGTHHPGLNLLRRKLPSNGRRLISGEYGGDVEFQAWAAISDELIFTISDREGQNATMGTLVSAHGLQTCSVAEALMAGMQDTKRLSINHHVNGNHWHAMLPRLQAQGRSDNGWTRALDDVNGQRTARAWLAWYDDYVDRTGGSNPEGSTAPLPSAR